MTRCLLAVAATALLALPAAAQGLPYGGYNPWTNRYYQGTVNRNPWTGGMVQKERMVNPWTGTQTTAVRGYNPWTGQRGVAVGQYNPWTNQYRYKYRYGY